MALPEADTGLPAEELVAALRAQLAELEVEVVLSSRPFEESSAVSPEEGAGEASALAFVWLGREGEDISVHFFEAAGATLRQRRLPLRGTDAASLEEVAIVVRSAVSALLERGGSEEANEPEPIAPAAARPPEAPEAVPTKSEPDSSPALLGASLGYSGQSYAPELPFSQGAFISLGVRPTRSVWGVGIGYGFVPAQSSLGEGVSVELSRHPLEAFFRLAPISGERPYYLGAEAGVGVDWIRRRSEALGPEFVETPDVTRVSWAILGRGFAGVRLAAPLAFEVHGGADLLVNRVATEVEGGSVLVGPRRVRPRVLAQIRWEFP